MRHPTSPFLDDHVRAGRGEHVAIETPGATLTYAALTDLANRTGKMEHAEALAELAQAAAQIAAIRKLRQRK